MQKRHVVLARERRRVRCAFLAVDDYRVRTQPAEQPGEIAAAARERAHLGELKCKLHGLSQQRNRAPHGDERAPVVLRPQLGRGHAICVAATGASS